MATYIEKLRDPRWQKKRLEIFNRDSFACQSCGSVLETLHVHHQIYQKGLEPWEYDDNLLLTLCDRCHQGEEHWKASDGEFMETMLSFRLTRCEINSFVVHLWDHLNNKKDKRKALLELMDMIQPTLL